jgi:hypothetical protein
MKALRLVSRRFVLEYKGLLRVFQLSERRRDERGQTSEVESDPF